MNKFYSAAIISIAIFAAAAQAVGVESTTGKILVNGTRTLNTTQTMDFAFTNNNPLQVQAAPGDQARITCDNGNSFLFSPSNPIETVLVLRNNNDCLAAYRATQNTGGILTGNSGTTVGSTAGGASIMTASKTLATAGFLVAGVATAAAVACAAGACGDNNDDVSPD